MEEIEVMNALNNVVGLPTIKIEKSNNQGISADNQDELNSSINESAENQEINKTNDPEQLKKVVSFNDKTYQPTFQMQPEIFNTKPNTTIDRQFVFGSAKVSHESVIIDSVAQESLDLLKRSIESLKNREFGNFADNIIQSVSKLSLEKSQQFMKIKNKISAAEIDEKLQNFGFRDIEVTLMDIEGLLVEILSNEHVSQPDMSEQRYVIIIQMLCDILSMLFEQFHDKLEGPNQISGALDLNIQSIQHDATDPIFLDVPTDILEISTEENDTKEDEINGKKICKCFSMNTELDKQSDEPVYANDTEMKTAKSVDLNVIQEQNSVPLKSYSSLISTKISDQNLRKVQNVDDLTKTESTKQLKSQSFMRSKDINEQPVELQTKYPLQSNIIQVSSIPSIITRYYHAENLNDAFLTESIHSIKSESMTNAIVEDLNDDGFLDLPKTPLSEASSSEWIDENISFVPNSHDQKVLVQSEPKLVPEIPKAVQLPVIPLESLCSVLNEPQLSIIEHSDPQPSTKDTFDPQPSTSAKLEPVMKKQKRFAGCKKFVKRLIPNTLLRKKDRN